MNPFTHISVTEPQPETALKYTYTFEKGTPQGMFTLESNKATSGH